MKEDRTTNELGGSLDLGDELMIDTTKLRRNKLTAIAYVAGSALLAYALIATFVAIEL